MATSDLPSEDGSPSKLRRRRSSLPNMKFVPMTMAERRLMARQKRKEAEEAAKAAAQQEAEERKLRMKQLRETAKAGDKRQRSKYTVRDGKVKCWFCGALVDELEFAEHSVSHPTRVRERVWLGNAPNSGDVAFLRERGVTHILNCTREIAVTSAVAAQLTSGGGVVEDYVKRVAIADKNSETILDYVVQSNLWLEGVLSDARHCVLVHCREGRSRSVSFLCAYLMWKERLSFHSALADIRSKRHIVLPNSKFYAELERLDKELVSDRRAGAPRFKKPDAKLRLRKVQNGKGHNAQVEVAAQVEVEADDAEAKQEPRAAARERSNSCSTPLSPKAAAPKKRSRKKKKKKSRAQAEAQAVDLHVEEAVDVTDVFPPHDAKRKSAKKKKKKRKKAND